MRINLNNNLTAQLRALSDSFIGAGVSDRVAHQPKLGEMVALNPQPLPPGPPDPDGGVWRGRLANQFGALEWFGGMGPRLGVPTPGGPVEFAPQPLPPGGAVSLNPQPLPPGERGEDVLQWFVPAWGPPSPGDPAELNAPALPVWEEVALNPQPLPPREGLDERLPDLGGPVELNPQRLPPGPDPEGPVELNPQPLPPGPDPEGEVELNPQPLPPGPPDPEAPAGGGPGGPVEQIGNGAAREVFDAGAVIGAKAALQGLNLRAVSQKLRF